MDLRGDRRKPRPTGAGGQSTARDIEAELRACNERVQTLLRLSTDFFWETDAEHRFTRFDRGPGQVSAFPGDGPIGKTRWELPYTRPDDAGWQAHREILEQHLPFRDFEFARCLPDGTERHLRVSGEPVFAADGSFLGYRGVGHDVTELKLAEATLRGSEARFRSLAELSSDWYWEQDDQFRFSFLSDGYQAITGLDPGLLLGRKRWDWHALNLTEDDWARHRAKLERHEPFFDFEIQRRSGRGHTSWLSISGVPMLGENGRFYGYRGIGRDITLSKRVRQLLALEHAVARCLAEVDQAPEALKAVIRGVCESESWDSGRYFRIDGEELRLEGHWSAPGTGFESHIEGPHAAISCPLGSGLESRLCKTGKPQWSADAARGHRVMTTAPAREAGFHGAFMFAVTSKGKPIGVLVFNSREIREPDAGLLQTARVIGGEIGQFLSRKHIEEKLRESEERFRSLADLSSDWYWEQDEQLRISFLSSSFQEKTGKDPAWILGRKRWDEPAPNLSDEDWARHRGQLERHEPFFDLEIQRTVGHGRTMWVQVSGVPVFDESGRFCGYRGVGRDITSRKRAQQLLALEHAVAGCLADADNVPEGLKSVIRAICESERWECGRYFRADDEAGVLRFSEFWCVPGAEIDEFIKGSRPIVYPRGVGLAGRVWQTGQPLWSADTSSDPRVMATGLAQGSGRHSAFVFAVTAEGKPIGILTFNTNEIREPDERLLQTVRVIGSQIGQFLTRKYAEEEHRKSEERFRSLTLLTSDTYWEQDDQYRFTLFAGSGKEWIDASRRRALGKRRWDLDYLNMTAADWAEHIAIHEARKPYRDLRLCRIEAGKKIWISVSGEPVFDASGTFKGYRGAGKDITDRVLAEEELHEREERFRRLTGLLSDGYWELDDSFRFTFASAGIEEAGFAGDELLGRRPWECEGMQASPQEWRALREEMEARKPFQEFVFSRPSRGGALRYFSISGLPVNDAAGRFQGYQGVARNVTEKVQSQERVQYLAYHDGLTGLRSRGFFVEALARAIEQARRAGRHLALIFIDLDGFKQINDTRGHTAGDHMLMEIAGRLTASFRKGDLIARLGGDEFVELIEDTGERRLLEALANKALAEVVRPYAFGGRQMRVTASIGISMFPEDAENENDLIKNADAAMYRVKEKGKNAVGFFSAAPPPIGASQE
ncbi:MAG: PAS domain S-box protein [Betaproteobacteria bacterium]|nr:PAS domain S-box protein [Betaproteobacteria bacterium]